MKKRMLISIVCIFLILLMSVTAFADTLDEVSKTGKLRIGVCLEQPPFHFRDKNNEPAGLFIDLSKLLAKSLNAEVVWVNSNWGGLIPNLLSGKVDIVAGAMSTLLSRAQKVIFSDPYFVAGAQLLVQEDSPYENWEEMNKPELKIATKVGTSGEEALMTFMPNVKIVGFQSTTELTRSLLDRRVDALVEDAAVIPFLLNEQPGLRVLKGIIMEDTWAFTLKPDDIHFWIYVNLFLEKTREDGTYGKLINYWWETKDWMSDYLR